MKKKKWIIPIVLIVLIVVLWSTGIAPKQIAKIAGNNYVNEHFPEMQMKCVNVEYSKAYGNYVIQFVDKDGNVYGCVIGPIYFPCSLGQGRFAIEAYYADNYK